MANSTAKMPKIKTLILGAGRGTRMASDRPKVLLPIADKPMIMHLAEAVQKTGIDSRPVIVISNATKNVRDALGRENYDYVFQDKQLGTGHATLCAEKMLRGNADMIFVLYGDHPCVRPQTIQKMLDVYEKEHSEIVMATTTVKDFEGWRKPLFDFGRIVRNAKGGIEEIVEMKDASKSQLAIRELNPAFFCFKAEWMWDNLKKIDNQNTQKEYYLTDLVRIAIREGKRVSTVDVNPIETLGVNTPEHLELVRKLFSSHPFYTNKQENNVVKPMIPHVSSGAIVYRVEKGIVKILLMYRKKENSWHLPKGTQNPGETIEETALREIEEETGFSVQLRGYVGKLHSIFLRNGMLVNKETHYFLANPLGNLGQHDSEHDIISFVQFEMALSRLEKSLYEKESNILRMAEHHFATG